MHFRVEFMILSTDEDGVGSSFADETYAPVQGISYFYRIRMFITMVTKAS
jgi:hypothetical protein